MMCRTYGVSRGGFYARQARGTSARTVSDSAMAEQVVNAFRQGRGLYGSPRVTRQLHRNGIGVGRRRVARLMRLAGLRGHCARLYRRSRVSQRAFFRRISNVQRNISLTAPNQVWVGDVTYVRVGGRWRYVATVMDKYSRRILGWSLGRNRDAVLPRQALHYAVRKRRPSHGVYFHTDRGIEYAAVDLSRSLARYGLVQSMNRPGRMNDNAHMESFFHSLKTERLFGMTFHTDHALRAELVRYIRFYNQERLHSSLDYLPPVVFERQLSNYAGVN
jgi:putative transposase